MNRVELSEQKFKELFGEVFFQGSLTDRLRELITLVVLTTNQTLDEIRLHVGAALNVGVTPIEIKEAIYQCAPYLGFPKAFNAMYQANEVFTEKNISLPVESQKQVNEDTRFDEGLKVQKTIFVLEMIKKQ